MLARNEVHAVVLYKNQEMKHQDDNLGFSPTMQLTQKATTNPASLPYLTPPHSAAQI